MASLKTARAVIVVWFLGVLSCTQTLGLAPPQPPTWPETFSVTFQEGWGKEQHNVSFLNDGAWYYDFGNKRARHDHLQGHDNFFCQSRGLKLKDKHGDCHLFLTDAGTFIHYPLEDRQCCRVCGPEVGCNVLKPNWLAGAKYLGEKMISGTTCHGWEKPGADATDRWYQTDDGKPCQYWEEINNEYVHGTVHTLTFNISTYDKVRPIPASVFDVPKYCNTTCPHPFSLKFVAEKFGVRRV